jgi:hypothetical protein
MLEGGGGGISGTNWNVHEMDSLWSAVANQETTQHWKLLRGWQTSYELTLQHLSDVKRYRDNLAVAWPPEKSPAAAAYVGQLNGLIDYLQGTYDAAVANHSAFSGATMALADSRRKVKALYDEYKLNQGRIDDHKAKLAAAPSGGLAGAAARQNMKPPVSDQRQQELTWQARSIMFGLSSEVSQAHTAITKPATYLPNAIRSGERDKDGGSNSPPPLPPIFAPSAASSSSGGSGGGSVTPIVGTAPSGPPMSATPHSGLVLGGTSPTPTVPPPITTGPAIPPGQTITSPGPINPPIGMPPISNGPSRPGGAGFMPNPMQSGGIAKPGGSSTPAGAMRSMPPGGVIGGLNGAALGQSAARSPQRVSPVGGVISPGGGGAQRAGHNAGARGGMPMGGIGSRSQQHSSDGDYSSTWDPNNPWQTDEGVAPVVIPRAEQRIDPGPAIGFDR